MLTILFTTCLQFKVTTSLQAVAQSCASPLQQYKDLIYKEFQKSPENPFNQVHASHNATRDEIRETAAAEKRKIEQRLAEKS